MYTFFKQPVKKFSILDVLLGVIRSEGLDVDIETIFHFLIVGLEVRFTWLLEATSCASSP